MTDHQAHPPQRKGIWGHFKSAVKTNLAAGLLVVVPLMATGYVLYLLVRWVDQILVIIPAAYRPATYLPWNIPGLGIVIVFMILFLSGFAVRNLLGRKLLALGEFMLSWVPFVYPLYRGVKQLLETIFGGAGRDFKRVVLLEYPRPGIWALAYVTGTATGEIQAKTERKVLNVFLPTTPNPTSGFYLLVPEEDVIPLDMAVEDSFKLLISGGIINPEDAKPGRRGKSNSKPAASCAAPDTGGNP